MSYDTKFGFKYLAKNKTWADKEYNDLLTESFEYRGFENESDLNLEYKVYAYQMHLSMIKRSVGLFSGFALMFLGTGVAFYSIKKQTSFNLKGAGITASLVTASLGIIAMVLGAFLIISTIKSKDDFPIFSDTNKKEIKTISLAKPSRLK